MGRKLPTLEVAAATVTAEARYGPRVEVFEGDATSAADMRSAVARAESLAQGRSVRHASSSQLTRRATR